VVGLDSKVTLHAWQQHLLQLQGATAKEREGRSLQEMVSSMKGGLEVVVQVHMVAGAGVGVCK
jgi:hypothetical protein